MKIFGDILVMKSEKQKTLESQGCVFVGQELLDNHEIDPNKECYCGRPLKKNGKTMSNNATAAQRRRMGRVAELGCLACRHDGYFGTPAEIHHCKEHGYRNHDKVAPLCPVHHKEVSAVPGILNRHLNKIEFAERYGDDADLHRQTCALLGEQP